MHEPTENPYAPTSATQEPQEQSTRHPARWLLITAGCLMGVLVAGLITMAISSQMPLEYAFPFFLVYGGIALTSFFLALSKFTPAIRILSILYGMLLGFFPLVLVARPGGGSGRLTAVVCLFLFFGTITVLSIFRKPVD